jgi:hypothetical protein
VDGRSVALEVTVDTGVPDWLLLAADGLAGLPRLDGAACAGRARLFDGRTDRDVVIAVEVCSACPVFELCEGWASGQRGLVGVVAGRMHGAAGQPRLPKPKPEPKVRVERTRCVNGHERTPENLAVRRGKRVCLECERARTRRARA